MPELPEVETARRGISSRLVGKTVEQIVVRERRLRWPIPDELLTRVAGAKILSVDRRAKYLIVRVRGGAMLIHLGMSGSLRFVPRDALPQKHDHVDLQLRKGASLRFRDPRRFGAMLWADDPVDAHPLLAPLGVEPLEPMFDGEWLYLASRGRRAAVKTMLMDSHVVVGVGNIYASEALHRARINPRRQAGRISRNGYDAIAAAIQSVLAAAIERGGTTLRDHQTTDGEPGAYRERLLVYGREGEACPRNDGVVRRVVLGQRSTFYCPKCQR